MALPVTALGQQVAVSAVSGLGSSYTAGFVTAVSDVYVGKGTSGPFLLSWRKIDVGSETVCRGARTLTRDTDYVIDASSGLVYLRSELHVGETLRVDYRTTPGVAAANSTPTVSPLMFNLARAFNGGLSLGAVYKPGAASDGSILSPGQMMLGLAGSVKMGGGQSLQGKLYMDAAGGDLLGRSALDLTDNATAGAMSLSAGYRRVGASYTGDTTGGLTAGQQVIQATAALKRAGPLQASASFVQTEQLPVDGKGAVTTVIGQNLTGAFGKTTRLQASHSTTATSTPGTADSLMDATNVQLSQGFGKATSLTALYQRTATDSGTSQSTVNSANVQLNQSVNKSTSLTAQFLRTDTDTGGASAVVQTTNVSLRSQPARNVTVQGSVANQLSTSGGQDSASVQVNAKPSSRIDLTALVTDSVSRDSTSHSRRVSTVYRPNSKWTLTGGYEENATGNTWSGAGVLSATAKPAQWAQMTGSVHLRDSAVNGSRDTTVPNTYQVDVNLNVLRNRLQVTGGVAENPESTAGLAQHARSTNLGLVTKWGAFDLSGKYTLMDQYLDSLDTRSIDLSLGWRLGAATRLTTGYHQDATLASALSATDTYSLGLTHRVGSALDLSLTGSVVYSEQNSVMGGIPDYRASANLGLRF